MMSGLATATSRTQTSTEISPRRTSTTSAMVSTMNIHGPRVTRIRMFSTRSPTCESRRRFPPGAASVAIEPRLRGLELAEDCGVRVPLLGEDLVHAGHPVHHLRPDHQRDPAAAERRRVPGDMIGDVPDGAGIVGRIDLAAVDEDIEAAPVERVGEACPVGVALVVER